VLLIVTQRGDIHADWLIAELHSRQASFVRFNTEDYPQRTQIAWRSDGQRTLRFGDREQDLAEISAVWYRRPAPPKLASDLPASTAVWARSEAREALLGVWRTLDAVWVNHPYCNRVAESKLNQLQLARELGFEVPATLVSNDRDAVREFMADHPGGVICKPLQDGRVPIDEDERLFFTSLLDPATVSLGGTCETSKSRILEPSFRGFFWPDPPKSRALYPRELFCGETNCETTNVCS
jgi:hypothetical protein